MSDRNLDHLAPAFRDKAKAVIAGCIARGIDLLVTCTARSNAEQAALYAQGRTQPGPIVTHAQAGQSAHNYGLAMDCYPMHNGKPDLAGTFAEGWKVYGEEAEKAGLEWAGKWVHFRELPHVQHLDWKTLAATKPTVTA